MLNFIVRKLFYYNLNEGEQKTAFELLAPRDFIDWISAKIIPLIFGLSVCTPIYILFHFDANVVGKLCLIAIICIYAYALVEIYTIFETIFENLAKDISDSIYFDVFTKKGKAITEDDFCKICDSYPNLFYCLRHEELCNRYCYGICFNLLDTLKCGELLLVAIRYYGDTLPYTMHAIYVKDNWCFDTYTQRQFPLTRFFELYEAKFYKEISYSEIEHLTYEEFILKEAKLMKEWCKENKCSTTFG